MGGKSPEGGRLGQSQEGCGRREKTSRSLMKMLLMETQTESMGIVSSPVPPAVLKRGSAVIKTGQPRNRL